MLMISSLHSQAAIDLTHASLKTFGGKTNYRLLDICSADLPLDICSANLPHLGFFGQS